MEAIVLYQLASLGFAVSAAVGVFLIWYALARTFVERWERR